MARAHRNLFDLPTEVAVRRLALQRLKEADKAAQALHADPEALHDFRVAVRRLRTLLRAYRDAVAIPKKWRTRLRNLACTTNAARDLEVALDNLRVFADAEPAVVPLEQRLSLRREQVRIEMMAEVAKIWPALRKHLRACFSLNASATSGESFGVLTTRLAEAQWLELQQLLAKLRSAWRDDTAHRARLAGKRLRYLLEPLVAERPSVAGGISALKAFQDRFGDHHDRWTLLQLIAEAGAAQTASEVHLQLLTGTAALSEPLASYAALATRMRQRRNELADALLETYVMRGTEPLQAVADGLTMLSRPAAESR